MISVKSQCNFVVADGYNNSDSVVTLQSSQQEEPIETTADEPELFTSILVQV